MQSRANRIYSQYPDLVTGYELNSERGLFSVIIPEATTNLVTNPTFGGGLTTGYAAYLGGETITAVATWQAYGAYGCRLTPLANVESGLCFSNITLTLGITYTFSVTLQGEAGRTYYLWIGNAAGTLQGVKKTIIATGHKQREYITYTERGVAAFTRLFYVTRGAGYNDTNYFYVDGFQVEEKDHPTTLCAGFLTGFVPGEIAYTWNGTAYASTSTRSAQTRTGGREVNLLDLGLRILAVVGLGMMPLVDRSLSIPGLGEIPQDTGIMAREFTLIAQIDEVGPRALKAMRGTLIDAFKPDLTVTDQPLILRYREYEEDEPCGESVDIICKYRTGLEGNWDNNTGERLALGFKMYLPQIMSTFSSGTVLGYQTAVANANYILKRGTDGIWAAMGTGANGQVLTIIADLSGNIIAGGNYTSMSGVANTAYIAKWNGTAWSALGTGVSGGYVVCLAVGPDGSVYAGGSFTLAGGVANTVYIAKWDGSVWTPLGTGMNGPVWSMAFDIYGNLIAGGAFTLAGGVADTVRIAKWNGVAWSALSTGMNGTVWAISCDSGGIIYAGGEFTTAGGNSALRIARYISTTWLDLLGGGANDTVASLLIGSDGYLYAGGAFTSMGGVPGTAYIAKWNWGAWTPISPNALDNVVAKMTISPKNEIYIGGIFTKYGTFTLPDSLAIWNGSVYVPGDINLPGAATFQALAFDKSGALYIGFSAAGTATSATITAPTSGNSKAYPIITFTGPGTLYQLKDYTTGKSIFFNLTLLAGETAVLNLDPTNFSFVSSFRGNLLASGAILPGSNLNFELMPGINNVSAFMYGSTTAATAIVMTWRDQYNALDGAAWK
jgi:hypothetical protein